MLGFSANHMNLASNTIFCIAALLLAPIAGAAVIFDKITGITALGSLSLSTSNGSPFGDSFSLLSSATITSVSLGLSASASRDGGSILVYLVPNASGNVPSSTGVVLQNRTLLGTILDSSLTVSESIQTLTTNQARVAGRYWIVLVNSSDTPNGGNGITSSAAWFVNKSTAGGVGTSGEFNSYASRLVFTSQSDASNTPRMIVQAASAVPEPISSALVAAGLVALILRRRR